jgi:hypothetical protein
MVIDGWPVIRSERFTGQKPNLRGLILGLKINHPEVGKLLCDTAAGLSETAGHGQISSPNSLL